MFTITPQELSAIELKCKINKVDGIVKLDVPADVTPEVFADGVNQLILRGLRNFSQGNDSHANCTWANLTETKVREQRELTAEEKKERSAKLALGRKQSKVWEVLEKMFIAQIAKGMTQAKLAKGATIPEMIANGWAAKGGDVPLPADLSKYVAIVEKAIAEDAELSGEAL
jgi:hypothetical protein